MSGKDLQMKDDSNSGNTGDDNLFKNRYGEEIGSGQSAVVYEKDGIAAKVYREGQPRKQVYQEAFTMAVVKDSNIPSPEIYGVETFCNRTALLMEKVEGRSLFDFLTENPDKKEDYMDKVVELQVLMHRITTTEFRPQKQVLAGTIIASPGLNPDEKNALLENLQTLPDGYSICHGDFHLGNVLFDGENYIIIDWAEVSCGAPASDACRSYLDYLIMGEGLEDIYIEKYSRLSDIPKEEILNWLSVTAGSIYGYLGDEAQKKIRHLF